MATVADLYASVLGRDVSQIDPEGLAYWTQMFGPTVDENEAATFKSVAQVTEPEKVAAVAAAAPVVDTSPAPSAPAALTVEDLYKTFYGNVDPTGAAYWKQQFGSSVDLREQAEFIKEVGNYDPNLKTNVTVEKAFKDYLGNNTDQAGIDYWKQQFGTGNLTADQLSQITNAGYGISEGDDGLLGTGINWTNIRDTLEAAAVVAGNYILPGSSLLTSQLVSEGAKEQLNTDLGKTANLVAGVSGGYQGNTANYGKIGEAAGLTGPTVTPTGAEGGAASGAGYYDEITGKFIPAEYGQLQGPLTNASGTGVLEGYSYDSASRTWTLPDGSKVDLSYLPNSETALTGAQIMQNAGAIAPATSSLTASQVIKALPLIPVVNQLTGDPLGLNPDLPTTTTPGGTSGNPIVPIPPDWKPPTYPGTNLTGQPNYTGAFKPIDLNSIFTDQNLLTGTQWQGLPNQRNMTFNDIFAAGQQSTPMGTPVNINNIVSAILGQTATSQKPA